MRTDERSGTLQNYGFGIGEQQRVERQPPRSELVQGSGEARALFWMRLVPVHKHKPLSIGPRVLPVI